MRLSERLRWYVYCKWKHCEWASKYNRQRQQSSHDEIAIDRIGLVRIFYRRQWHYITNCIHRLHRRRWWVITQLGPGGAGPCPTQVVQYTSCCLLLWFKSTWILLSSIHVSTSFDCFFCDSIFLYESFSCIGIGKLYTIQGCIYWESMTSQQITCIRHRKI